ncbi:MAG: Zn-dependent alcohol dehydrogenase [Deltaproteobacteria bacterium]|nr:Zn-dependent alcohol dehydrogenase [Deltaproteobacteria bacterium]MBW2401250.1 Zn-dependent alcohol dehydrogenase [Deltaproteobacteria bacterium]MBW2667733.1 Zn-dependent alcohol dehydrogenase [Deltaproteobacteria bacterium]
MRAALLRGKAQPLEIVDLEIAPPAPGEVKIRLVASGICRSDLSVTTGVLKSPMPVVLGHEAAGIVEELGEGVSSLKRGDRVVVSLSPACGECLFCNEGAPNRCFQMAPGMIGSTMLDGSNRLSQNGERIYQLCGVASFAEEAIVCARSCIVVDDDVPLERACLLGCGVLTGAGTVFNFPDIKPDTSLAIIGCGGVGLAAIQAARIKGVAPIIAIDIDPAKLTLAKELGAHHALDGNDDVQKAVRKLTGLGVHTAIEAIGNVATMESAWEMLRPGGLEIAVGMPRAGEKIPIRAGGLFLEKRLAGSTYGSSDPRRDIPRLLAHIRNGEFHLDPLVSEELPLERAQSALDDLAAGRGARHVIVFDH